MIYVTISEGKTALAATPIVASKDPDVVRAVLDAIARRLGYPAPPAVERPGGAASGRFLAREKRAARRVRAATRAGREGLLRMCSITPDLYFCKDSRTAGSDRRTYSLALRFAEARYSVCPIARDGTKRAATAWRPLQHHFPSASLLGEWFDRADPYGIALIHGAISGNSEVADIDLAEIADKFYATARHEIPKLTTAPWIQTPRPGYQLYYRNVSPPPGNLKLAEKLNPEWSESATNVPKWKTKIETRGEGGYTVTIGSPPCCHPNNRIYRLEAGSFRTVPILTAPERTRLHDIARSYDERPSGDEREHRNLHDEAARITSDGDRPGDDFNRRANWKALLEPHGWQCLHRLGAVGYWRRPGKKEPGVSATTNFGGYDLLYIFSSNADPFEAERGYTKFAAFALLQHRGDFRAAAAELWRWRKAVKSR